MKFKRHFSPGFFLSRRCLAICFCLFGFVVFLVGQPADTAFFPRQFLKIQTLLDSADYDQAIRNSQDALLKIQPNLPRSHEFTAQCLLFLGEAFQEKGDLEGARQQYLEALKHVAKIKSGKPSSDVSGQALHAQALNNLAEYFYQKNDWRQAEALHRQAFALRRQLFGEAHPVVAESLNNLGNCFFSQANYPEAITWHERALRLRQKLLPAHHPHLAASHNNLGNCLLTVGDFENAAAHFQQALAIRQAVFGDEHPQTAQAHNNLGNCFAALGERHKAERHYRRALEIRRKKLGKSHPQVAAVLENLGDLRLDEGDCIAALDFFRQAIAIQNLPLDEQSLAQPGEDQRRVATALLSHKIGRCLQCEGEFAQAAARHQASLEILTVAYGKNSPVVAGLFLNAGNCFLQMDNPDRALDFYEKARRIFQAQPAADLSRRSNLALLETNLGLVFLKKNDPAQALRHFQAVQKTLAAPPAASPLERAENLKNQGIAQSRLSRHERAQAFFDQALRLLAENFPSGFLSPEALDIQSEKAAALLRQVKSSPQTSDLRPQTSNLAKAFDLALAWADSLRVNLAAAAARQRWVERHFSLFEGAVDTYYIWWRQTGDPAHLNRAFLLAEKSKSLLLLEAMRKSQAERIAGVPENLLEKERRLGAELNRLEKTQLALLAAGDLATANRTAAEIAETRQELQALTRDFERRYPAYFQLKYAARTATPAELRQRVLQPGQALVEFFTGDSAIFVFVLTQEDFHCLRLAKDFPLETWTTELRRSLQAYPDLAGEAAAAQAEIFAERAFWLWQKIWSPLATSPSTPKGERTHPTQKKEKPAAGKPFQLPEKIVLVPDGALAFLPFEALLEEMPADVGKFKKHKYLLCKHQISYAYAATQLLEIAENQTDASNFASALAFAPSFENSPAGLRPLKFNQAEAKAAHRIFGGDLRLANQATLAEFFRLNGAGFFQNSEGGGSFSPGGGYQIILLATHGEAGEMVGDLSKLAFAYPSDSAGEPFLYLRDLYDLRLPAQLVILSACETGVGEYRSGEGVLSLARGFFQAGARSLVTTLWSVDDAKNAALMEQFFRHLKSGMDKDEALRQAKIAYLRSRPHDEAHPVFWAASVAVGEMEGLEFQRVSRWWWVAGSLCLLILIGGYFWKSRAKS